VVPENGVEPSRPCGHRILSPARLPVPPLGHGGKGYHITYEARHSDSSDALARPQVPKTGARTDAYRISEHVIRTQDRAIFLGGIPRFKIASRTIEVVRNVQNYYGMLG
jgi:hypothetical protein